MLRLSAHARSEIFNPQSLRLLLTSTLGVLSLGAAESQLVSAMPLLSLDNVTFALSYGLHNIPTSCVWESVDPRLVAIAVGLDPDANLNSLSLGEGTSKADAVSMLRIASLQSTRYMLAGFTLISQVFRVVQKTLKANENFKDNVTMGRERPFDNVTQRVIRLAGKKSDVTVVSMERYGEHIFPLFEEPEAIKHTVQKYSKNFEVPIYWHVDSKAYGVSRSYSNLLIDDRWLIKTSAGRNLLIAEADLVNDENSLSLGLSPKDLNLDNAMMAFRELSSRARECMATKNFRMMRVVLGDSTQLFVSGGGHVMTLRDRVLGGGRAADIIVDSRAPVLLAILTWFDKSTPGANVLFPGEKKNANNANRAEKKFTEPRDLLFFTNSKEYFDNLKKVLLPFGIVVLDGWTEVKKRNLEGHKGPNPLITSSDREQEQVRNYENYLRFANTTKSHDDHKDHKPMAFVHYTSTSMTVNGLATLTHCGVLNHVSACILVDKLVGVGQVEELEKSRKTRNPSALPVQLLCSSMLHDDTLRQVRTWARMGYNHQSIQEELDFRYSRILKSESQAQVQAILEESKEKRAELRQKKADIIREGEQLKKERLSE